LFPPTHNFCTTLAALVPIILFSEMLNFLYFKNKFNNLNGKKEMNHGYIYICHYLFLNNIFNKIYNLQKYHY